MGLTCWDIQHIGAGYLVGHAALWGRRHVGVGNALRRATNGGGRGRHVGTYGGVRRTTLWGGGHGGAGRQPACCDIRFVRADGVLRQTTCWASHSRVKRAALRGRQHDCEAAYTLTAHWDKRYDKAAVVLGQMRHVRQPFYGWGGQYFEDKGSLGHPAPRGNRGLEAAIALVQMTHRGKRRVVVGATLWQSVQWCS
eukprot:6206948-Pleurochrysis_carterae.AAC.2